MASHEQRQQQQQQQQQQSRLPPSPPPSPPRHRHPHSKRKRADPFMDLGTPLPSPPPHSTPQEEVEGERDPLIARIILTPILFTSFLISLLLVNREDRARRAAEHQKSSLFAYLSPGAWLDPEPYQDPDGTTWERRNSHTHVEPHDVLNPQARRKRQSWHLNKKIRQVAKLEIKDAFEMRGRIIVLMITTLVLSTAIVFLGMRWIVGKMWSGSEQ